MADKAMPDKINVRPEYKNGKFDDMGTALNMSFTEFVSTTWEFLFADNHRTPEAGVRLESASKSRRFPL